MTRQVHTINTSLLELVQAWCVVLNHVEPTDLRMASVIALPAFRGLDVIECTTCIDQLRAGQPSVSVEHLRHMTVTAAYRHVHLAPGQEHQLALDPARYEVTP